jgi:hypothetical protein
MRIVKLPFDLHGIGAITVYPWIFLSWSAWNQPVADLNSTLIHEQAHLAQQQAWRGKAWLFGLAAWFFCYLFLLPVLWNPFRRRWETEAYAAQGWCDKFIEPRLREAPYWLVW